MQTSDTRYSDDPETYSVASSQADDPEDPIVSPDLSAAADGWVERDRADLLYRHMWGGLVMTALTASLLVAMVASERDVGGMAVWLCLVLGIVALRMADLLVWHPSRRRAGSSGALDVKIFATGMLVSTALWAVFPLLFFSVLTTSRSTAAFVVMAAMAGGSASVLGPSLPLSVIYASCQLLVPGAVLFFLPGRENKLLGVLSVAMFISMAVSVRLANSSVIAALRLSRVNQALMAQAERQRLDTVAINQDLAKAQVALHEANQSLEQRIEARTADLALEMKKRQRYSDALARLATIDPLTGLCNRTTLAQRLGTMLLDCADVGAPLAVLFLDLDNFKQVNDARGHAAGDAALQATAGVLSRTVGDTWLVGRWGGDEFVLAAPATDRTQAAAMAETLRAGLLQPLQIGAAAVCLDATIGIAVYPDDGRVHDDLIRAADVAMYQAKKDGKGRIRQYDAVIAQSVARRHELEQAMRGAVDRGEFWLAYQPILTASGACHSVEALLRWDHPGLGRIEPSAFIAVAEQTGQIGAIGAWVLQEACRAAATWPGPAPAVTVNVSMAQALSGKLEQEVAFALAGAGLPAARLQLEITETMFVSEQARVSPVFQALRRKGHRILLDDFGTGFSSLACLGQLPIDVIKIDQSFVSAAERNDYAIIQGIISIARALSLEVAAEGVETMAQRDALALLGVNKLQGYLLARPMPNEALTRWLTDNATNI